MRHNESETVMDSLKIQGLKPIGGYSLVRNKLALYSVYNGASVFLSSTTRIGTGKYRVETKPLFLVHEPEVKRKIIGDAFMKVGCFSSLTLLTICVHR
jgi:hypothetical protein